MQVFISAPPLRVFINICTSFFSPSCNIQNEEEFLNRIKNNGAIMVGHGLTETVGDQAIEIIKSHG